MTAADLPLSQGMPTQTFAITWDYRCPFARNAHEHVLEALEAGADWNVTFVPFSLGQVHVAEGDPDIWETPEKDSGLVALQVGVAVRDLNPDQFRAVHRALFALRHDESKALNDRDLIAKVLTDNGVDSDAIFEHVDSGAALASVKAEHTAAAGDHKVWGSPRSSPTDRRCSSATCTGPKATPRSPPRRSSAPSTCSPGPTSTSTSTRRSPVSG